MASTRGDSQVAAAAASSSSLQRSIKPTPQIKPLSLAKYMAAQSRALASYSQPHCPEQNKAESVIAVALLPGKNNHEKIKKIKNLCESILNDLKTDLLGLLEDSILDSDELKFNVHMYLSALKTDKLGCVQNILVNKRFDLGVLLGSTNTLGDKKSFVDHILEYGTMKSSSDEINHPLLQKEYKILPYLKDKISRFVNKNFLEAEHFAAHIFVKRKKSQNNDVGLVYSMADVAAEELDLVDTSEVPEVSALLSSSLFFQTPSNAAASSSSAAASSSQANTKDYRFFNSEHRASIPCSEEAFMNIEPKNSIVKRGRADEVTAIPISDKKARI